MGTMKYKEKMVDEKKLSKLWPPPDVWDMWTAWNR